MYCLFSTFLSIKGRRLVFSWARNDSGAQYMRIPVRDFLSIRIVKTAEHWKILFFCSETSSLCSEKSFDYGRPRPSDVSMFFVVIWPISVFSRIADPHHFNADPDPSFHCNTDLDPTFILKRVWILVLFQVMQICDQSSTVPPWLILSLRASIVSVHCLPWLHFEPPQLKNFNFWPWCESGLSSLLGFPKKCGSPFSCDFQCAE